jgi:RNA 2',3'-cyclic 3'-phosphodiesterase
MEDNITRTFIAIDLPREIINEVERVQGELQKKNIFHGKLTEPENLHLTLKFLGEISEEQIGKVKEKLKEVRFSKFEAYLGELGVFNPSYIKLVWIHIIEKKILELQKEIDEKLKDLFSKEQRFISHLTIARVKNVKDKKLFLQEIEKIKVQNLKFSVREFYLMKSELKESGPEYSILETYSLK